MRVQDAVGLIAGADLASLGPTTWADLGCGEGTFTLALAELLAKGSTIHAMDLDVNALGRIPSRHKGVRIETHRGDFTEPRWPFGIVDGVLLANSLHYVNDQPAFMTACETHMASRRFLVVEYDTDAANPWVPFPVSRTRLAGLFSPGDLTITWLGQRRSVYRRGAMYAALVSTTSVKGSE